MARHRRLHGDLRRLLVADLADEDHVGILPERRAENLGEGQLGGDVDRGLRDPLEPVFDRVLDRDDVLGIDVDLGERGVERRRLPRSGRPADDEHAVRLLDDLAELGDDRILHPDRAEAPLHDPTVGVEEPQRHLLAEVRRGRGGTDVETPVFHEDGERPVLWATLLGDVHVAEHLHRREDRLPLVGGKGRDVLEDAVDAAADDILVVVLRLAVDVGGTEVDRLEEHLLYRLHRLGRLAVEGPALAVDGGAVLFQEDDPRRRAGPRQAARSRHRESPVELPLEPEADGELPTRPPGEGGREDLVGRLGLRIAERHIPERDGRNEEGEEHQRPEPGLPGGDKEQDADSREEDIPGERAAEHLPGIAVDPHADRRPERREGNPQAPRPEELLAE